MFKKLISATTCVFFLINSLAYSAPSQAAGSQLQDTGSKSNEHIVQTLKNLEIPEDFGSIEEKFQGDKGKLVIYIQDAHAINSETYSDKPV